MDDLPPWVVMMTENPVVRSVLEELFGNERFRTDMDAAFSGPKRFSTYVGDADALARINEQRSRGGRVKMDPTMGAATLYDNDGRSINAGGIFVDVDRLHSAVDQDSARARELVRDAFLHEFAHLHPVATARNMSARTGDPKVGSMNQASHPVIQGENRLRGLFGLPEKNVYGLMGMMER